MELRPQRSLYSVNEETQKLEENVFPISIWTPTNLTSCPVSTETILPISRSALSVNALGAFRIVVMPVSLKFSIQSVVKLYLFNTSPKLL